MTLQKTPTKTTACWECGSGPETWEHKRHLPQIGKTHECGECGLEVFVSNVGSPGEMQDLQLRPVTNVMATNLPFFGVVGDWPDSATEDLVSQGSERVEAIDYHVVERAGLSQTEWAKKRDVSQQVVSENIAKAKDALGIDD